MPRDFFGAPLRPLSPDSAPSLACDVCDEHLTGLAGFGVVARLARFIGLPELLAAAVHVQRGCSGMQLLLSATYAGGGTSTRSTPWRTIIWSAERAGCGPCPLAGGSGIPAADDPGSAGGVAAGCAAGQPAADAAGGAGVRAVEGVRPGVRGWHGIEVGGQLREHAVRGYHGEQGMSGSPGTGRGPWLAAQQRVGLRADSADYCEALVNSCRQRGRDYSVSVTDPRQKAPILRRVAARELREDEGGALGCGAPGAAIAGAYQPARGPEEQGCGVLRCIGDGSSGCWAGVRGDASEPRPAAAGGVSAVASRPAGATCDGLGCCTRRADHGGSRPEDSVGGRQLQYSSRTDHPGVAGSEPSRGRAVFSADLIAGNQCGGTARGLGPAAGPSRAEPDRSPASRQPGSCWPVLARSSGTGAGLLARGGLPVYFCSGSRWWSRPPRGRPRAGEGQGLRSPAPPPRRADAPSGGEFSRETRHGVACEAENA